MLFKWFCQISFERNVLVTLAYVRDLDQTRLLQLLIGLVFKANFSV